MLQVLRTVKSQANGHFTISAPGGQYILSITNIPSMDGVDFTEPVEILNSRTTARTYAVSGPVKQGQVRIVLTWGETPRDMDSHLDTPTGCHVYYGRKQCPSGEASLDTDVTDSYGPETINIRSLKPGVYRYIAPPLTLQPISSLISCACTPWCGGCSGACLQLQVRGVRCSRRRRTRRPSSPSCGGGGSLSFTSG